MFGRRKEGSAMSDLKIFNFKELQVRTVLVENEPWFVAKDVCDVLEITNPTDAMKRLDDDEHTLVSIEGASNGLPVNAVNEYGLYSLVLGSRKPEAKEFKRWITHDVIPSIRKHGAYMTPATIEEAILNPDFGIRLLTSLKEEREARKVLELQTAQQRQIIHELQPKATYYDLCLQNKTLLSVTKIAKDYGMSGNALNSLLHELGVQYKQGDIWLLYQKYADKGYTQSKTHVIDSERSAFHTYWTQSGRLFIYELLKQKKGILPIIEREQGLRLVSNGDE